jgi:amidase
MIGQEDDPDANFIYAQMSRLCPEGGVNDLLDALQRRVALTREWSRFLADYPVLLCPVSAEPPFPDLLDLESPEAFDRVMEAQLTQIATPFMGLPGLAVTTGSAEKGLPLGVQLVGGRFREDTLLAAGEVIEAAAPPVVPVDPA